MMQSMFKEVPGALGLRKEHCLNMHIALKKKKKSRLTRSQLLFWKSRCCIKHIDKQNEIFGRLRDVLMSRGARSSRQARLHFSTEPLRAATSVTSHHTTAITCYRLTCWLVTRPKRSQLLQTSADPAVAWRNGHRVRSPPAVKTDKHDRVATAQHSAWKPLEGYLCLKQCLGAFYGSKNIQTGTQCPPLDQCHFLRLLVGLWLYSLERVSARISASWNTSTFLSTSHESRNRNRVDDPNL